MRVDGTLCSAARSQLLSCHHKVHPVRFLISHSEPLEQNASECVHACIRACVGGVCVCGKGEGGRGERTGSQDRL